MGPCSENFVIVWFHGCLHVIKCTWTNLHDTGILNSRGIYLEGFVCGGVCVCVAFKVIMDQINKHESMKESRDIVSSKYLRRLSA